MTERKPSGSDGLRARFFFKSVRQFSTNGVIIMKPCNVRVFLAKICVNYYSKKEIGNYFECYTNLYLLLFHFLFEI